MFKFGRPFEQGDNIPWPSGPTFPTQAREEFKIFSHLKTSLHHPNLPNIFPNRMNIYFKPLVANLPRIDSFLVSGKYSMPIFSQITVFGTHSVESHGISAVWEAIPANAKKDGRQFWFQNDQILIWSSNSRPPLRKVHGKMF